MTLRLYPEDQLRTIVTMTALIPALARAFRDLKQDRFELPQRLQLADGGYLVMPTRHTVQESLVVKAVSISAARRPTIDGLVSWSSTAAADSVAAPAAPVTALRTGAIVGLATDLLADPAASTLMLFGAGALAADQVRAVHRVRPLEDVWIVARTPERGEQLAAMLRTEMPDTGFVVNSLTDRKPRRAHIVCCATPSTTPLFDPDELAPTAHVNAVGSYRPEMAELPGALLAGADLVAVDDRGACLTESGELIEAIRQGLITDFRLEELSDLIDRDPRSGGRTVFKSVGVAIQDWAAMNVLASAILEEPPEPVSG